MDLLTEGVLSILKTSSKVIAPSPLALPSSLEYVKKNKFPSISIALQTLILHFKKENKKIYSNFMFYLFFWITLSNPAKIDMTSK